MAPTRILSLNTTTTLLPSHPTPPFGALIRNSFLPPSHPSPLYLTHYRRISCPDASALSPTHFPPCGARLRFRVSCTCRNNRKSGFFEDLSVVPPESEWDGGDTWSTFGVYLFILHIPLSFGGLSVVSGLLHQPELDSLTEVLSIFMLQTIEFVGVLSLLSYTSKSQFGFSSIFKDQNISKRRSWIKASALGFVSLVLFFILTSFLADQLIGTKDVNDPTLRKILVSSPPAKAVCFSIYCFIVPLLEETVFRRFLLRSLASTMKWQQAIIISALVFSISHFSYENALQLFLIGSVLGSVYCWSGNIVSSIIVHSVYNAAILILTSSILVT